MKQTQLNSVVRAQIVNMGGLLIRQSLPIGQLQQVDPFLLLHHGEFIFKGKESEKTAGVPPHPHRGFSPVTFVIKGAVHHRDSIGNSRVVQEGGVQWLNAGRGLNHSERPTKSMIEEKSRQEIIQLWINTPSSLKMADPSYQPFDKEEIVTYKSDGVKIQVVAGSYQEFQGKTKTDSILDIFRIDLKAGKDIELSVKSGHQGILYMVKGKLEVNQEIKLQKYDMADFPLQLDASKLNIKASDDTVLLYLSGEPIRENVVSHGPFVMNSEKEIMDAMRDYQRGKMGDLVEEFEE